MTGSMAEVRSYVRYLPTYRTEPKNPFNREKCEKLIKSIIDEALEEFEYDSKEAEALSTNLSESILNGIKKFSFDRYKFVCVVTIGENYMQGFCDTYRCLWDKQKDKCVAYVYETPKIFAVATVYALYFN